MVRCEMLAINKMVATREKLDSLTDSIENIGIVFCSVDAPKLPRARIVSNKTVSLRIHGYKEWYQYIYSKSELDEIYTSIRKLNADKKTIYLNNDHGMLEK